MGLPQSGDWRGNGYDLIRVIVNRLTKMVYYKSVQTTITAPALAKVILNIVIDTMVYPTLLSATTAQYSCPSSSFSCTTS